MVSPNPLKATILCLIFWLLLSPLTGAATAQDDVEKIIAGLEQRYSGKSFVVDFSQSSTISALDITETATGQAWFSHPGKMKWRYLSPERHDIITNGRDLWIFRPEEDQVMVGDATGFFKEGAGGAFLSDVSLIRQHYDISIQEKGESWVDLALVPKKKNPDIKSIEIRVDRTAFEVTQVTTANPYGDTTRFTFTNIQFNTLPDDWFEFEIPEGIMPLNMN